MHANTIVFSFLVLSLPFLMLVSCEETLEEKVERLEQTLAAEGRHGAEQVKNEAQSLLRELNLEYSLHLGEENRVAATSPDGSALAWTVKDSIHYRNRFNYWEIAISGKIDNIYLAFDGSAGLITRKNEDSCSFEAIIFKDPPVLSSRWEYSCGNNPTISSEASRVYFIRDNHLYEGDPFAPDSHRRVVSSSSFSPKYSSVTNLFRLYSMKDGLWIFHGSAGYYRLYHYTNGSASRIATGLASPVLFPSVPNDFLHAETSISGGINNGEYPYFVYDGDAGRYRLRHLFYPSTIEGTTGATIHESLAYIVEKEAFLVVRDGFLQFWTPGAARAERFVKLPLEVKNFLAYNGGLAYTDTEGNFLLRQSPFSNIEIQLFELIQLAEKEAEESE